MTDQEIMDLVYEHADCFTSFVKFTDANILAFARAVRDYSGAVMYIQPEKV